MMGRFLFLLGFIYFGAQGILHAQETEKLYMVSFPDKGNLSDKPTPLFSPKAQQRRVKNGISGFDTADYPVYKPYLDSLRAKSFQIIYISRWLNAALISQKSSDPKPIIIIGGKTLPVKYLGRYENHSSHREESMVEESNDKKVLSGLKNIYGSSFPWLQAMHAEQLKQAGYDGSGVNIAVLDAGFAGLTQHRAFQKTKVLYTYDWVDRETDVYGDDNHGSEVLSCMAALDSGELIGMAPGAQYILFRTENSGKEYEYEEFLWAVAAEYADSIGVDIICASLGYNYFEEGDSHSFEELDGKTTLIARAAGIAAGKGIWVFVSAGNEGNDPWKRITTPADAYGITVTGATTFSGDETYFASAGPTADQRISPQLGAPGSGIYTIQSGTWKGYTYKNGSSFSNPMICGLAASLIQQYPNLPYRRLQELLYRSALHYPEADPYKGYGWPSLDDIDTTSGFSPLPVRIHLKSEQNDTCELLLRIKDHTSGYLQVCSGTKHKIRKQFKIQSETGGTQTMKVINRKHDTVWIIRYKTKGMPPRFLGEIRLENKRNSP